MSRILLSVPVSDAVQVATLNLGDYLYFQCMFPKDALDLFHLSESELEDAKENKRQSRILEKVNILFLSLYVSAFLFAILLYVAITYVIRLLLYCKQRWKL